MSYMPVTVASRLQHDRCSITVRWENDARVNFYISRSSLGFSMIAPTSIYQAFVMWARSEKKSMTAVLEHFDKISFGAAAGALTGKTFPSFKKFAAAALAVTKGKTAVKSAKSTVHAADAAPSRNDKTHKSAKIIDLAACSSEQLRIIAKSMGLDESPSQTIVGFIYGDNVSRVAYTKTYAALVKLGVTGVDISNPKFLKPIIAPKDQKLTGYAKIISEATCVTDKKKLAEIEDCMRHSIFHSTLDWQTVAQLKSAARLAVKALA